MSVLIKESGIQKKRGPLRKAINVIKIRVVRGLDTQKRLEIKTVAAERAFRMYMDAMTQNPEQIMKGDTKVTEQKVIR